MIKIRILCVGKLKETYLKEGCAEYLKRLSRFCRAEVIEVPERNTLKEESEDLLRGMRGKAVVLAVEGKRLSSEEFANTLGGFVDRGEELTFVIGSSCGLAESVKKRADLLLSFSEMTFPHQLMRMILLEQIYRAFMINGGGEYHK